MMILNSITNGSIQKIGLVNFYTTTPFVNFTQIIEGYERIIFNGVEE